MLLEFDAEATIGYGQYECLSCGVRTYTGGPIFHKLDCPHSRDQNLKYLYTVEEKERLRSELLEKGWLAHLPLSPIFFPETLIKQWVDDGLVDRQSVLQTTIEYIAQCTENPELANKLIEKYAAY